MKLVLFNGKRFVGQDDLLVDDELEARIFDSIFEADSYSAWYELVYGVQMFVRKAKRIWF